MKKLASLGTTPCIVAAYLTNQNNKYNKRVERYVIIKPRMFKYLANSV